MTYTKGSLLLLLSLLCLLTTVETLHAQYDQYFKEGNALYNKGSYAEAIAVYQKVEASDYESAALYYNLGNAHYKLNHIAPSIYYYEKALLLSPDDEDIKNNLIFAQNMTLDAIDVLPQTGFARLFDRLLRIFGYNGWAMVAVIGSILFVICFILYYYATITKRKRLFFALSIVFLSIMVLSLAAAFRQYDIDKKDRPAIIFATESRVKADPNLRGEVAFILHEGTKVQVLEEYEGWKKILLADGKIGWIPDEDIKEIR